MSPTLALLDGPFWGKQTMYDELADCTRAGIPPNVIDDIAVPETPNRELPVIVTAVPPCPVDGFTESMAPAGSCIHEELVTYDPEFPTMTIDPVMFCPTFVPLNKTVINEQPLADKIGTV